MAEVDDLPEEERSGTFEADRLLARLHDRRHRLGWSREQMREAVRTANLVLLLEIAALDDEIGDKRPPAPGPEGCPASPRALEWPGVGFPS